MISLVESIQNASLTVLEEIKKALFPLRDEELAALESSVLAEGIREPLIVWSREGKLILVDGHCRYQLAQKHNLPFKVSKKHFANPEEALAWVDQNQLARRNLTDEQRAVLLGRMYERQKKNKLLNLKQFPKGKFYPSEKVGSHATAKAVAKQVGVSEKTIRSSAEFAKALDMVKRISPEVAEKILTGQVPDALTELPKLTRKTEKISAVANKLVSGKAKKVKEALNQIRHEEREKQREQKRDGQLTQLPFRLFCCDIRNLADLIESNTVDAIITDSPYSKKYLPLYEELARLAVRTLKPGGSLFVMTGQMYFPKILQAISKHLSYHWVLAYLTPGGKSPQIWPRRVNTFWKPVLWFVKSSYSRTEWTGDVVKSAVNENDKRFHKWGQSISGMVDLVEHVTAPGDIILDPFMGAGTTGVAVLLTGGRWFIGSDIDQKIVDIAAARLKGVLNGTTKN